MEITTAQIQDIEYYLDSKGINYIDIRPEILDHILLDIEAEMTAKKTFEDSFLSVKLKWNPQLKETSSYLFGMGYLAPKIIITKAKKLYGKYMLLILASYLLPVIVLVNLDVIIKNPQENIFYNVSKVILALIFCAFLYLFFTKPKHPITTYGFILKTLSLNSFVGLLVLLIFFTDLKEINPMHIGMYLSFTFSTYVYYYFLKRHKEAIKKYKIS
ncbi:hypothetical protein [Polaribacter sp. R77954]|uniref:hypothetical protein n=1 Tax=Polaribacter sp. R77954 TaxID=3093870 RepID=UPI0037C544D7